MPANTIDKSDNIWFGTSNDSYNPIVTKFNGTDWIHFDSVNSELPDEWVKVISIDKEGNKWFGTGGGGVVRYGPKADDPVNNLSKTSSYKNKVHSLVTYSDKLLFSLSEDSDVRMQLFDPRGRVVNQMNLGRKKAGKHKIRLKNNNLAAGIYLVRLTTGSKSIISRLIVAR